MRSHSNSTSLSQNPRIRIEAARCLLSSPFTNDLIHVLASSHYPHTSVPSHGTCEEQPWRGLFLLFPPLTTSLLFSILKKNSEQAVRSWSDKVTSLYYAFQEEFCAPALWVYGEIDAGYLPAFLSHPLPFRGRWPLLRCVTRSKPWLVEGLAVGPYIPWLGHDLCLGTLRKLPSLMNRGTCEQRCPVSSQDTVTKWCPQLLEPGCCPPEDRPLQMGGGRGAHSSRSSLCWDFLL